VTVIDAAIIAAADDRASNNGSADNRTARHSSTGVSIDVSTSDAAHVAMNTNMSSIHARAAATPGVRFRMHRCKPEQKRGPKHKAFPNYFFHELFSTWRIRSLTTTGAASYIHRHV